MRESFIPRLRQKFTSNANWYNNRAVWTVLALITIIAVNRIISPNFFQIKMVNDRLIGSPINILDGAAPILLLSIGMTLVIATEGVDLSVGAVMAISAAVGVVMINKHEAGATEFYYQPAFVILAALAAGALCGLWNGILVAFLDIQPIVATLILMTSGRGIAQMITDGQSPTFTNDTLAFIGRGVIFGLPFTIYLYVGMLILTIILVRRTAIGLLVESVGINDRASFYAGINAALVKVLVYVVSGVCAAIAGLVMAGEVKSADPHKNGEWAELDAILAVVIGGTALSGGRFSLVLSAVGALIIQSLLTGLYVSDLHPTANLVVKALVVLLVLLIQSTEFRYYVSRLFRTKTLARLIRSKA
ncbi:MAG: ABC transporter permease [Anaerolineae bacterium]|nr:ABC transporter permease [Anaerolineae bacterium]